MPLFPLPGTIYSRYINEEAALALIMCEEDDTAIKAGETEKS